MLARVRRLRSDSRIRYDAAGKLSGKWRPGQWTWHSSVEVTKIELKEGILKIKANRILLNYSRGIHKFMPLRTTETVEIESPTPHNSNGKPDLERETKTA